MHTKKKLFNCLRTQSEWENFFLKVDMNACGMIVKDLDWSVIMSIVMGYRCGKFIIPDLDRCETVQDKIDWINTYNDSKRKFKISD